jgi:hypothetical protein
MSSLLHQAVELAQAGQRPEARQLLWQFLQTDPNNEVAWLWLASVAADQAEYLRALNETLRINPGNERARQLLAEFQQQQHYGRPAPPATPPPTPTPYAPSYGQPAQPYSPLAQPSPIYTPPSPPQAQPPVVVEREVRTVEKRRGCLGCSLPGLSGLPGCFGCLGCGGCGQGCLLALIVLVIVPVIACGALSYSSRSLGPLDIPAGLLPGEFGRKTVTFDADDAEISMKVPRSWVVVDPDDEWWEGYREFLDGTVPFDSANREWADLESIPGVQIALIDLNLALLAEGGDVIGLALLDAPATGDFSCAAIQQAHGSVSVPYKVITRYDDDLCGYREDTVTTGPASDVFKGYDPPAQTRTITFYTPVSATAALEWQVAVPEDLYDEFFDSDIEAMIKSVDIKGN